MSCIATRCNVTARLSLVPQYENCRVRTCNKRARARKTCALSKFSLYSVKCVNVRVRIGLDRRYSSRRIAALATVMQIMPLLVELIYCRRIHDLIAACTLVRFILSRVTVSGKVILLLLLFLLLFLSLLLILLELTNDTTSCTSVSLSKGVNVYFISFINLLLPSLHSSLTRLASLLPLLSSLLLLLFCLLILLL